MCLGQTGFLVDVSDIYYFFSFPGRGRGGRRPRRWPGCRFFIENRGRGGGVSGEEAREGEGLGGNICGERGGGG